jgi:hypothetical protein
MEKKTAPYGTNVEAFCGNSMKEEMRTNLPFGKLRYSSA